jgi:hypothetical protein
MVVPNHHVVIVPESNASFLTLVCVLTQCQQRPFYHGPHRSIAIGNAHIDYRKWALQGRCLGNRARFSATGTQKRYRDRGSEASKAGHSVTLPARTRSRDSHR